VRRVGKERYRVFEAPHVTRLITRLDSDLAVQSPPARNSTSDPRERPRDLSPGLDLGF
jgi:hypothetical protein